jgi:hypothetical protein
MASGKQRAADGVCGHAPNGQTSPFTVRIALSSVVYRRMTPWRGKASDRPLAVFLDVSMALWGRNCQTVPVIGLFFQRGRLGTASTRLQLSPENIPREPGDDTAFL